MLKGVSQSFRDRADSAAFWESWVGAVLARTGLTTIHNPFEIDGKDHGQSWDIEVCHNVNGAAYDFDQTLVVEIKSLKLEFNHSEDYPFQDVLVCSRNSFLRKWPGRETTGRDFLLVSKVTGSMVWVPMGTKVGFKEILDGERGTANWTAYCQKEDLRDLADFVGKVKYGQV
jgi:hypothetical protein